MSQLLGSHPASITHPEPCSGQHHKNLVKCAPVLDGKNHDCRWYTTPMAQAGALTLSCAGRQAVQKAAAEVGAAQKTIQSGGAVAPAVQQQQPQQQVQAAPAPPTININIPGLGGNGGAAQGPPGISYTPSAVQGTGQACTLIQNAHLASSYLALVCRDLDSGAQGLLGQCHTRMAEATFGY